MEDSGRIINEDEIKFHHPFTMCVSGSTGSGKSEWVKRFLENVDQLVDGEKIERILYCYGELNPNVLSLQRRGSIGGLQTIVHSGLPEGNYIRQIANESGGRLLVVLDDLMVGMDGNFLNILFTRGSHNWRTSVILVTQHLFTPQLKIARNNSHYIVLMKNPAGALQIRNLAAQLFPGRVWLLLDAYSDATRENYGYLLIDLHPSTPSNLRLRTNIYPSEGDKTIVYLPK